MPSIVCQPVPEKLESPDSNYNFNELHMKLCTMQTNSNNRSFYKIPYPVLSQVSLQAGS